MDILGGELLVEKVKKLAEEVGDPLGVRAQNALRTLKLRKKGASLLQGLHRVEDENLGKLGNVQGEGRVGVVPVPGLEPLFVDARASLVLR